jgi:hypothetical protein
LKEATIRFRCSHVLKEKLELLAAQHEQTLSDYVRAQLVALVRNTPATYPEKQDDFAQAAEHAPNPEPRRSEQQIEAASLAAGKRAVRAVAKQKAPHPPKPVAPHSGAEKAP